MLRSRDLLLSYRRQIVTLLEQDTSGLFHGFNIYGEADIRDGTVTTAPALYIVAAPMVPLETSLPMIVLESGPGRPQFYEMGSRNGRRREIRAHVYAVSLGQRDDLAEYLADPDVLQEMPIYSFGVNYDDETYVETAKIDHDMTLNIGPNVPAALQIQGTWRWQRIVRHVILSSQ